ncbi:MAG TPA: SsrA-binding protein SmpB [Polyangiaceae bacterium]|jgi:SsrA-binding protein
MAQAQKQAKQPSGDKLVSKNRRAYFDYDVEETLEAGLVLIGSEVRALREGPANLVEAWVDVDRRGEAWVKGMRIATLKHAAFGHEEVRPRKLLMHREQLDRLKGSVERDGMTLIVTKCYFKSNRAKVEIALARGKKKHDKRQALREKDASREAQAAMRRGRRG